MTSNPLPVNLRIHGDNIIECERGLNLIAESFGGTTRFVTNPPYMPRYEILNKDAIQFEVELLAGHGRWGVNLQNIFQLYGAPLREAADAIITKITEQDTEEVLVAIEFSSALPAGNNAWQRNGRALACAIAGIPYLYYTEIGGVELDENREIKAPRFPNPIVPFSYLTASQIYGVLCLPVYSASPSSSSNIRSQFSSVIGVNDAKQVIRHIIEGNLSSQSYNALVLKTMEMVRILSNVRRQVDTLRNGEWFELYKQEKSEQKASWLIQKGMGWSKKRAGKVNITPTFQSLISLVEQIAPVSVGASSIPICLIAGKDRVRLSEQVLSLYGGAVDTSFINWLNSNVPLVIVWITGFKPRGDDSRPDRGLVPLARMLFGDRIDILSIVSGPAKPEMWTLLQTSPQRLAQQNGLWQTIINLSNGVLVDSPTLSDRPVAFLLSPAKKRNQQKISFPMAASSIVNFSEHDVDSVIHLLFSTNPKMGIFEAMCNPPGGDWSGLSLMDYDNDMILRWASLPRVSAIGGKRPDHVIQIGTDSDDVFLLAIESKDVPSKIANNLGPRLTTYVRHLITSPPTAFKKRPSNWKLWTLDKSPLSISNIISGGAFRWTQRSDLKHYLEKHQFDIVMAIEFDSTKQSVLLHVLTRSGFEFLLAKFDHLAQHFGGRLKIQVY